MKYYVDKNANRLNLYGLLPTLFFPAWAIVSLLLSHKIEMLALYGSFVIVPYTFLECYFCRRRSSYSKITDSAITSYSLFGQKFCTVFLDQVVYFYSFETYITKSEIRGGNEPFIALSNRPFTYYDPTKRINFLGRYNVHTIIVFPYDDRTKPLLPVEKWIQVV